MTKGRHKRTSSRRGKVRRELLRKGTARKQSTRGFLISKNSLSQRSDVVNPDAPCTINVPSDIIRASYLGALRRAGIPCQVIDGSEIQFALAYLERSCYVLGPLGDKMALATLDMIRSGEIWVPS